MLALAPLPAAAQTIPTVDTEDASLGSLDVGAGRLHPVVGIDLRNGDFARGGSDDDAANLDRLPVHLQLGLAWDLHHDRDGKADWWLVGSSSNGFHAPSRDERTSHETSLTAALDGERGIAALHPHAAVTVRPKGGGGVFTQVGVEPEIALGSGDGAPSLSFPALIGVGWNGFYEEGSGDVAYGSAGVAYSHPFTLGGAHWRLRAEALAVARDPTLRRIGSLDAETARVVPLATIALTLAY